MNNKHIGQETLETMSSATWYNNWLVKKIQKYLKGDILEVGFGIGNFTEKLSKFGKVTAIDNDPAYINKNISNAGIIKGYGDIEKGKYFFKDKKFDTILCINVLEHIKNDRKALVKMSGLLNKKGILILLVPAHQALYSEFDKEIGHFRRYSKKLISDILGQIFNRGLELTYINWWAAIGWFIFVKMTRSVNLPKSPVLIFDKLGSAMLHIENIIKPPFGLSVLAIYQK